MTTRYVVVCGHWSQGEYHERIVARLRSEKAAIGLADRLNRAYPPARTTRHCMAEGGHCVMRGGREIYIAPDTLVPSVGDLGCW